MLPSCSVPPHSDLPPWVGYKWVQGQPSYQDFGDAELVEVGRKPGVAHADHIIKSSSNKCLSPPPPLLFSCYQDLTNCTFLVADKLECFWPNQQVDEFFVAIHKRYFTSCPIAGRVLGDPPNHILCPFILVPTFITLLMTALVMWRSKHGEGII